MSVKAIWPSATIWVAISAGVLAQSPAWCAQPAAHTFVYECAGEYQFVVDIKDGVAWVFMPGNTVSLPRVPSGSGEKYSDGEIVFWSKGQEAMLDSTETSYRQCRNNRAKAIWENSKLRGNDFRAVGNEPGWVLEISSTSSDDLKRIVFIGDYGQERHDFPTSKMSVDTNARLTIFEAEATAGKFVVTLEGKPCQDTMSGEGFQTTVMVDFFGKKLQGCGNALH
jgi:membrane-bound inhibitor of C-type lysozyme